MKQLFSPLPRLVSRIKAQAGFTMIELLIVISILGILAVAVLSAINPIEQINRGRDTGSQSDAEQLVSAIDRYYAYNGTYPWQGTGTGASALPAALTFKQFTAAATGDTPSTVNIMNELVAKDELKTSYMDRVTGGTNLLSIYNQGGTGNSTYVCFVPQSKAFKETAKARCVDAAGTGLPDDIPTSVKGTMCANYASTTTSPFYCLP